jgi:hypothetical protein
MCARACACVHVWLWSLHISSDGTSCMSLSHSILCWVRHLSLAMIGDMAHRSVHAMLIYMRRFHAFNEQFAVCSTTLCIQSRTAEMSEVAQAMSHRGGKGCCPPQLSCQGEESRVGYLEGGPHGRPLSRLEEPSAAPLSRCDLSDNQTVSQSVRPPVRQ